MITAIEKPSNLSYDFIWISRHCLQTQLRGSLMPQDIEAFTSVWVKEIRKISPPRLVLFDISRAHPKTRETVKTMAGFLREQSQIDAMAFVGMKGAKLLVFRMLTRLAGQFPFEYNTFKLSEEGMHWLQEKGMIH